MKMFLGHPTKCSRTEKCFSGHSKYVYILKMFSGGTKINVHARKMFLELILECTGIFLHLGKHSMLYACPSGEKSGNIH